MLNSLFSDGSVASSPFPAHLNKVPLYKVRGDLYAGAVKVHEETEGVTAELELLVDEKDGDEIWNLTEGDSVEVGRFQVGCNTHACTTMHHMNPLHRE